jgi:hypothetical protein
MKASELLAQLHEIVAVHGGEMLITVSVGTQEFSADSVSHIVEGSLPVRVVVSSTEGPMQTRVKGLADDVTVGVS